MSRSNRYSSEVRERAVRMVFERGRQHEPDERFLAHQMLALESASNINFRLR